MKCISPTSNRWKINYNEASCGNPGIFGIGTFICDSNGNIIKATYKMVTKGTNNKVELEALSLGLDLAI